MPPYLKHLLFLLPFYTQLVFAQDTEKVLLIDSLHVYTELNNYLTFCESPVKSIGGDDFFGVVDTTCFENPHPVSPLLADNYISKISLRSSNEYPIDVVLVYGNTELLVTNAIVCEGELIAIKRAGFLFDWHKRDVKEGNRASMSLKLLPNKTYQVYAHIKKHYMHYDQALNINVELYPIENWHQSIQKRVLIRALFIGLLTAIFLFVLFLYFNNRKPEYFYYLAYLATTIICFMAFDNIGAAYLFPENIYIRECILWFPLLSISFYILFIRFYINTLKYNPRWDQVAKVIIVISLFLYAFTCLNPFHEHPFLYQYFKFPVRIAIIWTVISSLMFYIQQPNKIRFYFLVGNAIFFLTLIVHLINIQFKWIIEREQFMFMGVFFESLAFAMGLAYKMRLNEKEKDFAEQQQMLLQIDKENLKQLNQLRSRFFANISHEFRTPLTLILTPLDQFKQSNIAPSSKDLGIMHRYAKRLHQLINQVLDLSRIEALEMKLAAQELDVVRFLQARLTAFQSMAANKSIDYKITLPNKTIKLFFDPDKLVKIINNLLSNAFKFTPIGGKVYFQLSIAKNETSSLEEFVAITIQDNGVGIPLKEQEHVFKRFYQVDNETQQGTGIGLALVKEFVTLHHGHIVLKSKEGEGATFNIYLPLGHKHLMANEIATAEKSDTQQTKLFWETATTPKEAIVTKMEGDKPIVLLVEDNPDLQDLISQSLLSNYQLLQAYNGQQGLEMAQKHIPDLIISDIMMPKMDGLMMCKQLKKDNRSSHIPIILLTAKVGKEERLEGLKTGAIDYLAKPFDLIELNVRIQSLIKQVRAMQSRFSQQIIRLDPEKIDISSIDEQFIQQLTQFIESRIDDPKLSVEQMAAEMAFSRVQFYRKLKGLTGLPPRDFLRLYRLKRAKQLIEQQYGNISEIAYTTGFADPAHFSKCFKKAFGLSPSEFAKS